MRAFDIDNPYFRTKVMTANPAELRMMLLEGAVRFMREGREGLLEKNFERVYDGFSQARAIVTELLSGLRDEIDPQLCERLRGLYTYMFQLLVDASFEKSVEKADEAIELMEYEVETWGMVMERLAGGVGGTGGGVGGVVEGGRPVEGGHSSLSIEG